MARPWLRKSPTSTQNPIASGYLLVRQEQYTLPSYYFGIMVIKFSISKRMSHSPLHLSQQETNWLTLTVLYFIHLFPLSSLPHLPHSSVVQIQPLLALYLIVLNSNHDYPGFNEMEHGAVSCYQHCHENQVKKTKPKIKPKNPPQELNVTSCFNQNVVYKIHGHVLKHCHPKCISSF